MEEEVLNEDIEQQPLFLCEYALTLEELKSYYLCISKVLLGCFLFFMVILIFSAFSSLVDGMILGFVLKLIIGLLIGIMPIVYFRRILPNRVFGQYKLLNNLDVSTARFTFCEDAFYVGSTDKPRKHTYDQIRKIHNFDRYITLIMQFKLLYSLRKDAFIIGDSRAFTAFIREKSNAKYKDLP